MHSRLRKMVHPFPKSMKRPSDAPKTESSPDDAPETEPTSGDAPETEPMPEKRGHRIAWRLSQCVDIRPSPVGNRQRYELGDVCSYWIPNANGPRGYRQYKGIYSEGYFEKGQELRGVGPTSQINASSVWKGA